MAEAKPKLGTTVDPYRNYNFLVQVQDISDARFVECSGLGMRIHPILYRESGNAQVVRALPGRVEYGEVTLRYGLTDSLDMWNWLLAAAQGIPRRRRVSIVLLDADGTREGFRWNLMDAWACEWRGVPLDALGREAAIEEMHLRYDTLDRS